MKIGIASAIVALDEVNLLAFHQDRIVELLAQHVVRGDYWTPTIVSDGTTSLHGGTGAN